MTTDPRRQLPPGAPTEDPMAADRRTLLLAGAAMVALVAVGVISGALFARSACAVIGPEAVAGPEVLAGADLARTDPGAAVAEAFGVTTGAQVERLDAELAALADHLGDVTAVAAAQEVHTLARVPGGFASIGSEVTTFGRGGVVVDDAVDLDEGVAVGDADHLYSLALTNPLTGQVDALQPLDADLSGMTCVDTALVGSPLAFHLDAGGGELLVLRIEEDGDDAELELRDPIAGRSWAADLELPGAPAGLAGARLTARLGPELVVAASRTTAGDEVPVVTAVDRRDGAPRWTVDRAALDAAGVPMPDAPLRAEVAAAGDAAVLVGFREVDGEGRADEEAEQDALARGAHRLAVLDAEDGSVLAVGELTPGERVAAAALEDELALVVVTDVDAGTVRLLELSAAGLSEQAAGELEGVAATLAEDPEGLVRAVGRGPGGVAAPTGEGRTVIALGDQVVVLDDGGAVSVPLPALDVVRHDGGTTVVLAGQDGARALVTFGG